MIPAELSPLAAPVTGELYDMTFSAYHHLLELRPAPRHPNLGEQRAVQAFGWVARQQGRAVGLALAEAPLCDDAAEPQLLSIFVRPEARQQGIGTALVAAVEATARELGHRRLGAVYTTGKRSIPWVVRIFAARGWDAPRPGSLVATFAPQAALGCDRFTPILVRGYRRGLEIFPWSELGPHELDEIRKSDDEQHWIAPALNPWQYDPQCLDASSFGARCQGQVVGWVLNHRVSQEQVRWSVSYMHPALSRRGKVMALYHASLTHLVEEGACQLCTFTTPFSYEPMALFAQRWIGVFARSIEQSNLVGVSLEAKRPAAQEGDALPGGAAPEPGERRLTAATERL
jgi:GNAT superfamily N-acetyltransferase